MRLGSLLTVLVFWAGMAMGADPICVRNWKSNGTFACDQFPNSYTFVYPKDTSIIKKVCARIYSPVFCDESDKYAEVKAVDGSTICVMNFNQPPAANLCESMPSYYYYILSEAP